MSAAELRVICLMVVQHGFIEEAGTSTAILLKWLAFNIANAATVPSSGQLYTMHRQKMTTRQTYIQTDG